MKRLMLVLIGILTAVPAFAEWNVLRRTDKMTDEVDVSVTATGVGNEGFASFSCIGSELALFIARPRLIPDYRFSRYGKNVPVKWRVDEGKVQEQLGGVGAGSGSLVFIKGKKLWDAVRGGTRLRVHVLAYAGDGDFDLDLTGLAAVIGELGGCK
jgi:hypothetical protein